MAVDTKELIAEAVKRLLMQKKVKKAFNDAYILSFPKFNFSVGLVLSKDGKGRMIGGPIITNDNSHIGCKGLI